MKPKNTNVIGLCVVSAILLVLFGCKKDEAEQQEPAEDQRAQQPAEKESEGTAPEFTLKSFSGEQVSLSDYKGKIVVLEWFNDECPFVRYHYEQADTMIDLANKYKDQGVVWLAVNSTSHVKGEQVQSFAEKHNIPYPILDDRSGEVGKAYGAERTPHMFVIDKEGDIVYEGAIDNAPIGNVNRGEEKTNYVEAALSELINGDEVTIPETAPYGCTVKYAD